MRRSSGAHRGFTLVEMMITLAVIIVLLLAAVPSFISFRQRAATRGAAEQVLSLWNQARLEAAKRNSYVKFGVKSSSSGFCVGVATTTDPADSTPCDCTDAAAATNKCDIALFPDNQSEWGSVSLSGTPTLGSDSGVAVIDPKVTTLAVSDQAGAISLAGPPGARSYRLNVAIDSMGRGYVCESVNAPDHMSDFTARKCNP